MHGLSWNDLDGRVELHLLLSRHVGKVRVKLQTVARLLPRAVGTGHDAVPRQIGVAGGWGKLGREDIHGGRLSGVTCNGINTDTDSKRISV